MGMIEDLRRGLMINSLAAHHAMPGAIRHRLLRHYGVNIARSSVMRSGFYVGHPEITIGEDSYLNAGCFFDHGPAEVRIGSRCDIGMQVVFCRATHEIGGHDHRAADAQAWPIVVGDGCWVGARVTLLPGVTIAPGCIIASGAVVTRDTLPDGLYGGVPAVRLRDLDTDRAHSLASNRERPATTNREQPVLTPRGDRPASRAPTRTA